MVRERGRPSFAARPPVPWHELVPHAACAGVPMHIVPIVRELGGDVPSLRAAVVPSTATATRSPEPRTEFACDAVCCGFGLRPATDVTRLLGRLARVRSGARGWPRRRRRPALPVPGSTPQATAPAWPAPPPRRCRAARCAGRRARPGRLGAGEHARRSPPAKRACVRAARFGGAMTRIANVGAGAVASIAPDVDRVPLRTADARASRPRDRRRLRDDQRTEGRDALRHGPLRRPPLRGSRGAADRARDRPPRTAVGPATARPPLRPVDSTRLPAISTTRRCRCRRRRRCDCLCTAFPMTTTASPEHSTTSSSSAGASWVRPPRCAPRRAACGCWCWNATRRRRLRRERRHVVAADQARHADALCAGRPRMVARRGRRRRLPPHRRLHPCVQRTRGGSARGAHDAEARGRRAIEFVSPRSARPRAGAVRPHRRRQLLRRGRPRRIDATGSTCAALARCRRRLSRAAPVRSIERMAAGSWPEAAGRSRRAGGCGLRRVAEASGGDARP